MEELKNLNTPGTAEPEAEAQETAKGFNAYMEIYDEGELIVKVCGIFDGDARLLSDKDVYEIKTFLFIKSGISRSEISHSVFEILSDDDNRRIINYYGEDDDEE